jgi:hypothetical protein
MEKTVNNPRKMAEVGQIRASTLVKEKPTFYELNSKSNEFELKEHHQPKRRLEFNLASQFYLCDIGKYLCTHLKDMLNLGSINYIESTLAMDTFIKLAIGNHHDQYQKFIAEWRDAERKCYIPNPNGDGSYYIMPAFRLDFLTESDEDLAADQLRKVQNIGVHRIKTVTFSMAKPIFEKYLILADKQYYRHPAHLYANIYDIISKNHLVSKSDLADCPDLATPAFIAGYIRFIDYLYLHGAGTNDRISLSFEDTLTHVMPSFVQFTKDGIAVPRDAKKLLKFLITATNLITMLDGLDYKLKCPPSRDSNKMGYMIYELNHPHKLTPKSDQKQSKSKPNLELSTTPIQKLKKN